MSQPGLWYPEPYEAHEAAAVSVFVGLSLLLVLWTSRINHDLLMFHGDIRASVLARVPL